MRDREPKEVARSWAMGFGGILAALLLFGSGGGDFGAARAQEPERVLPREPAPAPPPKRLVVPEPEQRFRGDEVVLPALRGIALVAVPEDLVAQGVAIEGVRVAPGLSVAADTIEAALVPYIGAPLTLDDLDAIAQSVVRTYRDAGLPFVDVIAPEQDISTGAVQLVVLEFRVGHIRVERNEHFSSGLLRKRFGVRPGERIVEEELETGLERLNANPFRRAELLFERGKRLGETDLILSVRDRLPLRAYAGYENTGVDTLGRGRWFLGFNWGNAFGLDHLLSYQLTTSSDFWTDGKTAMFGAEVPRFVAHAVSWKAPLPWGHKLLFSGVYAEVDPELPTPFRAQGETIYTSLRYELPLPDWRGIEHELAIGGDYKRTDNNLAFGGQAVLQNAVDVFQGVVTYSAAAADDLGSTDIELSLVLSPGGITSDNTDFAFRGGFGRPGAEADYAFAIGRLERTTRFSQRVSWHASLTAQIASDNLLALEQLGLGGVSTVRGYEEREFNADAGVIVRNQMELAIPRPAAGLIGADADDLLKVYGFLDLGRGWNVDKSPLIDDDEFLSGTGIGVRYSVGRFADLRLELGVPLSNGPDTRAGNPRLHVGVVLAY